MRRGLVLSALKQALIFGMLVALSWSLNAVRVASIVAECPPMLDHMHGRAHGSPFGRHFGPEDFGHDAGIRASMMDPRQAPDLSRRSLLLGKLRVEGSDASRRLRAEA